MVEENYTIMKIPHDKLDAFIEALRLEEEKRKKEKEMKTMKLFCKDQYFQEIKAGTKTVDFRDAHITFINEETNEILQKKITHVDLIRRPPELYPDVLNEDHVIRFFLDRTP